MRYSNRRTYLLGGLFVLALTLLFTFANWHWLRANVVTYGWDRMDHLITSLVYRDMFSQVTPSSITAALAYSDYYPPLFHYGIVLLYRLFGVDEDIAPMVNVLYLFILLGATFWIGAHTARSVRAARSVQSAGDLRTADAHAGARGGRLNGFWAGALAATLLGLFPMIFAMSRYLYLDFALTALVALCVALLLAAARFARRWASLGFGLALGLAFLLKWTTAAFLVGPLVYIILRSGVVPYVWRQPRALLPGWKWLAMTAGVGVALVGGWFALAQDAVAALPLGWWLALPLGVLLGGVLYALFAPQRVPNGADAEPQGHTRLRNMLGAGVIAAFVIALWYLTNIEFLDYFLFTAYGREDEPIYAFGKYLAEIVQQQLGPWFAAVFVVVAVVWGWQAWHARRRAGHGHMGVPTHPHAGVRATRESDAREGDAREGAPNVAGWLSDVGWVLLLWVVVPYFVFSFRVTLAHSRYVMPFLPPLAVWMAVGLWQWRPPLLRGLAVALVLCVGVAQYVLISFDELAPWRASLRLQLGEQQVNPLANGFFIQYPTSGVTDPGYAVAPEVLAYVDGQRLPGGALEGKEVAHLGLLVNLYQVHEKHFLYPIYQDFPSVRLRELARNWREQPAYNQLFDMDYVLVSDTHTFRTNANSQHAVQRILHDPKDAFNQAFAPVRQWTLPTGEQLTLYGRRFPALEPGVAPGDYQELLAYFGNRLGLGDAVVLVAPDQVYMLGLALPEDAGATIAPLPLPGEGDQETAVRLQALAAAHNRIFLLSHNAEQVDPNGSVEAWLRANTAAGSEQWAGSVRVTPFVPATGNQGTDTVLEGAAWRGGPVLASASVRPGGQVLTPTAGGALMVTLRWGAGDEASQAEAPLKASLQLLGPDGALVAQEDREIARGEQQFVPLIPRSAAPGEYRLALVVYEPATGQRRLTNAGEDSAGLGAVMIGAAPVPVRPEFPELRHPEDGVDEEDGGS